MCDQSLLETLKKIYSLTHEITMSLDGEAQKTTGSKGSLLRHEMFAEGQMPSFSADSAPDLSGQKNNGR